MPFLPERGRLVLGIAAGGILLAGTGSNLLPPPGERAGGIQPSTTLASPASSGALEGQVLFAGSKIPQATHVENTTDPQDCGKLQSLENVIISRKNRGIKNVIVRLQDVHLPRGYRVEPSQLVLDNQECRFRPHVAVLTTGSSIEAVNSDPFFHSVHLYGFRNVNLALAPKKSKRIRTVRRPGTLIVKCDIHGWMQAFIRVDDHPFHSVSGADGSFRIEGIPPGSYTLEAWHEYFGRKGIGVRVEGSSVSRMTIYYRSPE